MIMLWVYILAVKLNDFKFKIMNTIVVCGADCPLVAYSRSKPHCPDPGDDVWRAKEEAVKYRRRSH